MKDGHSLIYVDDSGNEEHGLLFSAVVLPAETWATSLGYWLKTRKEAEAAHGLPSWYEIHSVRFLSGSPLKDYEDELKKRADIVMARLDDPILDVVAMALAQTEIAEEQLNRAIVAAAAADRDVSAISSAARMPEQDVRDRIQRATTDLTQLAGVRCLQSGGGGVRREIYRTLLRQINGLPQAAVFTVHAADHSGETKARLYSFMLQVLNDWLIEQDRWGSVFVDGTPSARVLYYREAHRALELTERRIIEDETLRGSAESHFIQMADMCAHSAFAALRGDTEHYAHLEAVVRRPADTELPGFFSYDDSAL